MEISEAINRINEIIERCEGDDKTRLSLAVEALKRSGGDYTDVSPQLNKLLSDETRLDQGKEKFSENVYLQALAMKRRVDCKNYLKNHEKIMDGETQSMWITRISAVISLAVTAVFLVLASLCGIEVEVDNLAYLVTLISWVVVVVITIIAHFVNKAKIRKFEANSDYTIAELMATKYEDSNALIKVLLPRYVKNINTGNNNGIIGGWFNRVINK